MTTLSTAGSHTRPGRSGLAIGIMRALRERLSVWRARHRARSQLAAMSDRELQDIGTCRSEIADDLSKPFWRA
ncbi:DUF1127 domain-containing protein [Bradyrhizobium liaoningense]|uniref:DUF1127 domain-containing protein n=1 Tax=Bradyrhizobium liaoningense TaxID=43992 RepID=UPI002011CCAF|nr:DUF1127 domain-containing protein [Bradyrhizobium liaoningense]